MRIATFNSASEKKRRLRILRNRRATNSERSGDHPIARPTGILQAKNFSNLPHRQSLGGHRTSHCVNRKRRTLPVLIADNAPRLIPSTGWPPSFGLDGRFPSESVAALPRIPQEVVNGLMYILSTGCQWRAIPKDLPPRSSVYDYFDLWTYDGTLERIHHAL